MPDKFTPQERSIIMSKVKNHDTKPEHIVRKFLHKTGYRFRVQRKDLPGKPDIVLPKYKTAIFVHGCFWHGHKDCPRASRPTSNTEFWNTKLDKNIQRDLDVQAKLREQGWNVLVIWQCQTKDEGVLRRILADNVPSRVSEIPMQVGQTNTRRKQMAGKAEKGQGARAKLREYFLRNVGKVMDAEELREVAQISEWARRVRELRDEEGYKILSNNDRSELKPGEYLLEDPVPKPAFERDISKEVRAYILDRNGFTCQMCGAVAGEPHPYDPTRRTRLHIGHIIDKSMGGTDDISNLRAECSICNEGGSNLKPDRPTALKLLTQIRRAPGIEQLEVLKWLVQKFPKQAKEFMDS